MNYKKVIIFACLNLMFFQIQLLAQQYLAVPDSNAKWIIEQEDGWGWYYYYSYELSPLMDDTIINSKSYIKINNGYYGSFRNIANGVSYYVPPNSQEEYILRDFSKETGDTIKDVAYDYYDWNWVLDFIVDSTKFATSGLHPLKIMYLHTLVEDTIPEIDSDEPLIWIEKVGSVGGGILNSIPGTLGVRKLYCMDHNDTIYFNWGSITNTIGQCLVPIGINESGINNCNIIISPNPAVNSLKLSHLPINKSIEIIIYNLSGHVTQRESFMCNNTTLTFELESKMNTGMYFLRIVSKDHILLTKKIIKR